MLQTAIAVRKKVAAKLCRQYYPAWQAVRERNSVKLKVAPHRVARVRKAVIKEKDMDLGYKMQRDIAGQKPVSLRSSYDVKTWILSLWLQEYNKVTVYDL